MAEIPVPPTLGLVLAGGLARRMGGGDKARIEIGGVSILDRVLACLSAQCTGIIINANGEPERFADTGLTVVPDNVPGFVGPLAGILAGLDWLAAQNNGIEWLLSVPGESLRKALVQEDLRKIEVWTARHGVAIAEWPAEPVDPFLNVNTPEDAERAERIALQHHGG